MGNLLAALKSDHRANRASNDTQSSANTNDELTDGSNTDTVIGIENTDNTAIAAENMNNAATDGKKSDDAAMSDDNTDNTAMSDNNTDEAATGNGYTENTTTGETSKVEVPSPLYYGRKTKDPSKVKTYKKHTPIMVEPSIGDPPPDEIATVTPSGHAFDPTDVHIYEFLIQGTPNPLDFEGIEEDQLVEIQ